VEEIWPRPARPYLRNRRDAPGAGSDPFCAGARLFRWEVSWDGGALERILQRTLPDYLDYMSTPARVEWAGTQFSPRAGGADARRPGRLLALNLRDRASCGRVAALDVETDAGIYHVRGDRVRWVLAPPGGQPSILYSALFTLEVDVDRNGRPRRVTARGRGNGHGVGLCQEGAIAMARRGFTCGQILAHYYPGAQLAPLGVGAVAAPAEGT
jgi:stage II sporulation protein D